MKEGFKMKTVFVKLTATCHAEERSNNNIVLYSYSSPVLRIIQNKRKVIVAPSVEYTKTRSNGAEGYSATTIQHINRFINHYKMPFRYADVKAVFEAGGGEFTF